MALYMFHHIFPDFYAVTRTANQKTAMKIPETATHHTVPPVRNKTNITILR